MKTQLIETAINGMEEKVKELMKLGMKRNEAIYKVLDCEISQECVHHAIAFELRTRIPKKKQPILRSVK